MANLYDIDFEDVVHKLMPTVVRNADMVISNGDIAYTDTTEQDMYLILQSGTGNWYQYPRVGFNLRKKLNSNFDKVTLKQQIIDALKEDGIKLNDLQLITQSDVQRLGITDPEILSKIKQNKIIISARASR